MTTKFPQTQADELSERVAQLILERPIMRPDAKFRRVKNILLTELNLTELLADKQRLDWLEVYCKKHSGLLTIRYCGKNTLPVWAHYDFHNYPDGKDETLHETFRTAISTAMEKEGV